MCNTVKHNNTRPVDLFNTVIQCVENPSLLLYVCVVYAVLKNRHQFKNVFFVICISLAFGDFIFIAVQKVIQALQVFCSVGALVEAYASVVFGNVLLTFWDGAFFAQMGGVLLLCLNRYTAIVLPLRHSKIWTPFFTAAMLVLQWAPAVVYAGLQMLVPEFSFVYTVYSLMPANGPFFSDVLIFMSAYEACLAVIMCAAYVHMIVCLYRQNNNNAGGFGATSGNTGGKLKKNEVKLTLLGAVLTGSMLVKQIRSVIMVLQLKGYYANDSVEAIVAQRIWVVCKSIFNYSNPYFLLYTSGMVRRACRKELLWLLCRKGSLVSVASVGTSVRQQSRGQQSQKKP